MREVLDLPLRLHGSEKELVAAGRDGAADRGGIRDEGKMRHARRAN